jgi:general secretion pathway protein C
VVILLSVYLLAYLAELTWRFIPQTQNASTAVSVSSKSGGKVSAGNSQLNLAKIKQLNLFGDLSAEPVEEEVVTDAPVTRLNLTLTGVVTSSLQDQGAAIIENSGKQETYGLGEKITNTNATLKEVYRDRVIIKNGLASETLMLDGLDYSKPKAQTSNDYQVEDIPDDRPQISSEPQRRTLSEDALKASRELQQQPANFTDFIAITPHRPSGELEGYRVSPGKKPTLFKAAGLKAGDIVTEINGLDLTDTQQSLEAMGALRDIQSLQMTISRAGDLLTIYLDLPSAEQEL